MNSKIYNGNVQPNPKEFKIWVDDEGTIRTWNGTEWIEAASGGGSGNGSGESNVSKIEFIDLGLPSGTLWAKANLGAIHPAQQGLMYAWGELDGHVSMSENKNYTESEYKFYDSESGSYIKYNKSDGITSLLLEDDAAYQYDNTCRTPTVEQVWELIENTNYEFIYVDSVNCIKLTANNGNYICLPIYSSFSDGSVQGGSYTSGAYMTTGLSEDIKNTPKMLVLNGRDVYTFESPRYYSMMIRPVKTK